VGTPALWSGFTIAVLLLLTLDLWVFHGRAKHVSHRAAMVSAALQSAAYVALSLGFDYWILRTDGSGPALNFFAGYLIEKSLSADNLLVFLLVFRAFGIEEQFQHRVLFWGVLGAFVLRGLLIAMGAALLNRFAWTLYVFGAFLVVAGVRTLVRGHPKFDAQQNRVLRWAGRLFPVAKTEAGGNFFAIENGRCVITKLFVALLVIEAADLLFAVDSIPAVFGITRDPFLVYTSNVCAILGLRAFYTLLAGALPLFRFLDSGIAAVLIFIGSKMLIDPWIHVPTYLSLAIVAAILTIAVIASKIAERKASASHA
jgi:tellurite resistance protein TerC